MLPLEPDFHTSRGITARTVLFALCPPWASLNREHRGASGTAEFSPILLGCLHDIATWARGNLTKISYCRMLLELSESLRPPPRGITPPGLKLTADAGRFEQKGRSSGRNIFRKSATACCPVAFRPSPFRIACSRLTAAKSISSGVTFFLADMLPSPQLLKSPGERFGIPVIRERIFGQDYAKTLASWRNNFRATSPHLMPSDFRDRFRRLWEYYLAYCGARFLSEISTCARWCSQSRNSSHRTIGCKTGFHFCCARSRVVTRFGNARFSANEHQP
jgi:hypothetical protein